MLSREGRSPQISTLHPKWSPIQLSSNSLGVLQALPPPSTLLLSVHETQGGNKKLFSSPSSPTLSTCVITELFQPRDHIRTNPCVSIYSLLLGWTLAGTGAATALVFTCADKSLLGKHSSEADPQYKPEALVMKMCHPISYAPRFLPDELQCPP